MQTYLKGKKSPWLYKTWLCCTGPCDILPHLDWLTDLIQSFHWIRISAWHGDRYYLKNIQTLLDYPEILNLTKESCLQPTFNLQHKIQMLSIRFIPLYHTVISVNFKFLSFNVLSVTLSEAGDSSHILLLLVDMKFHLSLILFNFICGIDWAS